MPKIKVVSQNGSSMRALTDGWTDRRYQTYYLPCFAFNNYQLRMLAMVLSEISEIQQFWPNSNTHVTSLIFNISIDSSCIN